MLLIPLLIVTIIFSVIYLFLVIYFLTGWLRLKKQSNQYSIQDDKLPFVSVVIPVRNEADRIKQCLESLFKQNYPAHLFEVIVIDDYSTDTTLQLAREFKQSNLKVLDLMQYLGDAGEHVPNKKKAIALGIKNAKGEFIITSDGDCISGENRIRSMVEYYQTCNYKLVTAPVMIKPAWFPLQVFQQFDSMNMLGITGATIRNNFPILCNGANLMYAKQTFLEVEGFKGNHDVPSGDDIFLMNKIQKRYPGSIGFLKNFDACVFTKAESGIGNFFSQRKRWLSKSRHFANWKLMFIMLIVYLFNLLVLTTGIFALQMQELTWLPFAVAGGVKLFADLMFNIPVTFFFRKWYMLLLLPAIEAFHIIYVIIIGLIGWSGSYRWKDRVVR